MSLMKVFHADNGLEHFLANEPVFNVVLRLSLALEILHGHGGILVALIELANISLEEGNSPSVDMATTDESPHIGAIEQPSTRQPISKAVQLTRNPVDTLTCQK